MEGGVGEKDYNTLLLGEEGMELLRQLRFMVVGLGGLGSFVAQELVRLGAKNLLLVDFDKVEPSNLNRQILYEPSDVGKSKALTAVKKLKRIAPDADIEGFDIKVSKTNAGYLVKTVDVVIDCTDNFETKKILNRASYISGKAFITGGVGKWEGWVASFPFFKKDETEIPCLECLFPEDLEVLKEIEDGGPTVVTTVAVVASVQVQEVINLLLKRGEVGEVRTLIADLRDYQFVPIKLNKNPECPVCSK